MSRDNREVENTLLNKFAFTRASTRAGDHRWLQLELPELPPIVTKFSHTREDIGDSLWKKIAGQLRVQANYLTGMINCRKNREDYYKQVRTDPHPPWSHLMRGTAIRREEAVTQPLSGKRRKTKKK